MVILIDPRFILTDVCCPPGMNAVVRWSWRQTARPSWSPSANPLLYYIYTVWGRAMNEELIARLTDSTGGPFNFGGPLGPKAMQLLNDNPYSLLKQALAGYINEEAVKEMAVRWLNIIAMIQELKDEARPKTIDSNVTNDNDNNDIQKVLDRGNEEAEEKIPEPIRVLQAELRSLQEKCKALETDLKTAKIQQMSDFNSAMKDIPDVLKGKLVFEKLDGAKHTEFTKLYEEKAKSVDGILKVAGKAFPPPDIETLKSSVNFKAELVFSGAMLVREGDENLKPKQVAALSKLLLGKLVHGLEKNHGMAQELKQAHDQIATKTEALIEAIRGTVRNYEIPMAPPPPAPSKLPNPLSTKPHPPGTK
ncbi:MAG TPA: hypothetical protein VGU44_00395, partial [Gammaproteobacteria bacterium]|nr:hypothetical protein [Gammaproteobacteria bacterium]